MVVKHLNTIVTLSTMLRSWWAIQIASFAKFIREVYVVCIVTRGINMHIRMISRDDSRISERSFEQKSHCRHVQQRRYDSTYSI